MFYFFITFLVRVMTKSSQYYRSQFRYELQLWFQGQMGSFEYRSAIRVSSLPLRCPQHPVEQQRIFLPALVPFAYLEILETGHRGVLVSVPTLTQIGNSQAQTPSSDNS